jgi:hypothetical protein
LAVIITAVNFISFYHYLTYLYDDSVVIASFIPQSQEPPQILPRDILIIDIEVRKVVKTFGLMNHEQYAAKHGYQYKHVLRNLARGRNVVWSKISALQEALTTDVQWVWALDSDAIIMNDTLRIQDHILNPIMKLHADKNVTEDLDFIGSKDCNGFNAGSFFMRNSPWARCFLEQMWKVDPKKVPRYIEFPEQATLAHLLSNDTFSAGHYEYVPMQLHNSYPEAGCGTLYQPEDFVMHFAGWKKDKMFEYLAQTGFDV